VPWPTCPARRPAHPAGTGPAGAPATGQTFSNPVLGPGQDPSVITYRGWYYFTQTSPDATYITIRRARSIKSLAAAPSGDPGAP